MQQQQQKYSLFDYPNILLFLFLFFLLLLSFLLLLLLFSGVCVIYMLNPDIAYLSYIIVGS